MTANDVNNVYNVGAHDEWQDVFQRDDSINETLNKGDETILVREGQYSRYVRGPTLDDAEDEHVSRQDHVTTELKHALLGASNNANGRAPASALIVRVLRHVFLAVILEAQLLKELYDEVHSMLRSISHRVSIISIYFILSILYSSYMLY